MTVVRLGAPSSMRLAAFALASLAALSTVAMGVRMGVSIPVIRSERGRAVARAEPGAVVVDAARTETLQIDRALGAISRQVQTGPAPFSKRAPNAAVSEAAGDGVPPADRPGVDKPKPLITLPELPITLPGVTLRVPELWDAPVELSVDVDPIAIPGL